MAYYYYNGHIYFGDNSGVSIDLLVVRIQTHKI